MTNFVAELIHAEKSYDRLKVLDDITLSVKEGELLGIIGPSGSGKTTAIKCLLGLEKLDHGEAHIFNKSIPNRQVLNRVGYMGQTNSLYDNLTAYENMEFFGYLAGLKGKPLKEAMKRNLKLVDLEDALHKKVNTFSGGMKRRLSLAISLLSEPGLIILDEPTVGIDPKLRKEIWSQLRNLRNSGQSIIVTTHVMDEAERCDRVALIVEGRLFALDTPKNLKERFNSKTIEEVFIKAEGASRT